MKAAWLALIAAATVTAGSAEAATINNGSFETPTTSYGDRYEIGSTGITGWTVVGNDGSAVDTAGTGHNVALLTNGAYSLSTPFGAQFVDLTGYSDTAPYAGLSQAITTVADQAYTVTFWLGSSLTNGLYVGPVSVKVGAGDGYTVIANDGPLDPDATPQGMQWTQQTYNFTATGTSTTLSIIGNSSAGGQFIGLDNVSIADAAAPGAVPEAATWAMMIVGMGAIGFAMRRRKVTTRVSYAA